jgi:hypothetical protein
MRVGIGLIGTVSASVATWFVHHHRTSPAAPEQGSPGQASPGPEGGQPAAQPGPGGSPEPGGSAGSDAATGSVELHRRLDDLVAEQTEIRKLLERMSTPA